MNTRYIKTKILLLIINLSFIIPSQGSEYSVGWELWYPYQFYTKNGKLTGVDVEAFKLIAKKAELPITFVEVPWRRHLKFIKSGMIDIAIGTSYTKVRAEHGYFSTPYRKESVNLFVKKGTSKEILLNKLSDLLKSDYLIGIENGYSYGEVFSSLSVKPKFNGKLVKALNIEQNAELLINGRINGFLADPVAVKSFTEKYNLKDEFEKHPLLIYQTNIHIMLSKKTFSKDDLAKVNQAIVELKKNGELNEVFERWSPAK